MTIRRRLTVSALVTGLALSVAFVAPAQANPRLATSSPDAVLAWNVTATQAAVASGGFQVEGLIRLAYVQAAVYDAVVAIDPDYEPYVGHLRGQQWASVDAAVAAAAHATLVVRYPAQQASLDAAYSAALASVPPGRARDAGVRIGLAAAADVLAARQGDGLDANVPYTFGSGPGVWVLPTDNTAPAFQTPQTPWVGQMRPFLLASASQFLPGPPPALTSARYAADLNETQKLGSRTSTARTPDQTEVALFWSTNAIVADYATTRALTVNRGMDAAATARALAMDGLVEADAGIACFNAKYHYSFWRPYTAVRGADTDGNPATTADPNWLPLLATPNHPEYPAAHGCVTAAQAETYAAIVGSKHIDVDMTSTVTGTTRHYATVHQMTTEVVNARVWGGLHYRTSAEVGVTLGRQVADAGLCGRFEPTRRSH